MATGDQNDMIGRLKAALPPTWFPNTSQGLVTNSPVIDAILSGVASVWVWVYAFLQFVKSQTRIATASGVFLDMIAADFFGTFLTRRNAELDAAFCLRILKEMFRPKVTRAAMIRAITELTGRAPAIFEPAYPLDTGGWGTTGMTAGTGLGYGVAGGWGSLALPFQYFIIAYRPTGGGVASVAGFGHIGGFNGMPGGWGVGAFEYASLSMVNTPVTDQNIYDTINDVKPVATIAWTSIRS